MGIKKSKLVLIVLIRTIQLLLFSCRFGINVALWKMVCGNICVRVTGWRNELTTNTKGSINNKTRNLCRCPVISCKAG